MPGEENAISKNLKPGDRVALVCPLGHAGGLPGKSVVLVRGMVLEPVVYPTCRTESRHGYFAAEDARRAGDFQDAFADPSAEGIIRIRGGYGAARVLPLIDWQAVADCPKPFFGYSDVTAIHIVFKQPCGMMSFQTTMPSTEWYAGVNYPAIELPRTVCQFF